MLGARDEAAEFDEMDSGTPAEMFNDDPRFDLQYKPTYKNLAIRRTDCSQSSIFPWDFRDSYASLELPPSWFIKARTRKRA